MGRFEPERTQPRTRSKGQIAVVKDERGADRLLQWQERDSARTARDAYYDGGGTSARTPVSERDGTHSECPHATNPQNYFSPNMVMITLNKPTWVEAPERRWDARGITPRPG